MKKTFTILTLLMASVWSFAANYSTIAAGTWSDNSAVWSTDGLTPCGCNPGSNFADNVTVRHNITMDVDLTVMVGGQLNIQTGGILADPMLQLTVDGTVNTYGVLSVKSLKIDPTGSFVSGGLVNITQGPMSNAGSMIINSSFELMEGIFENQDGGYIAIGPGVRVEVMTDDAFNKGTIEFMGGGACLNVETKNFYNQNPNGRIVGYGGVFVQGDLTNLNYWESGVNWCAMGTLKGTGWMPPENCAGTCTEPYPVILSDFRADVRADFVNLTWRTFAEQGMNYYAIEKSFVGETCTIGNCSTTTGFTEIGRVPAQGGGSTYYFTDKEGTPGVLLYRLRMVETAGAYTYSPVVTANLEAGQPGLLIYPNPTNGDLNIRLTGQAGNSINVVIYDIAGRKIWEHKGTLSGVMQEITFSTCDLASGTYLVKYNNGGAKEQVRKLVVQK